MRNWIKLTLLCANLGAAGTAAATSGDGLIAPQGNLTWARWQARLSLGVAAPAWRANLKEMEPTGLRVGAFGVSGDYYFSDALFDQVSLGGLRATSGLTVGQRAQGVVTGAQLMVARGAALSVERRALAAVPGLGEGTPDFSSLPYFGVGYTGFSQRGKWSVSADLGVVA
ncbi:MAG: hypothetical protein ABL900_12180, partial [Burkholderiaceae bacterium]